MYGFRDLKLRANSPRTKLATAFGRNSVSFRIVYSATLAWMYSANCTISNETSAVLC